MVIARLFCDRKCLILFNRRSCPQCYFDSPHLKYMFAFWGVCFACLCLQARGICAKSTLQNIGRGNERTVLCKLWRVLLGGGVMRKLRLWAPGLARRFRFTGSGKLDEINSALQWCLHIARHYINTLRPQPFIRITNFIFFRAWKTDIFIKPATKGLTGFYRFEVFLGKTGFGEFRYGLFPRR